MLKTFDQWLTTEPPSGYDAPVEPTAEEERISHLDELQQREDALLEISRVQREFAKFTPCPVDLIRWYGAAHLTLGTYASVGAAMLASEEISWIANGDGTYRSRDAKTVIRPVKV